MPVMVETARPYVEQVGLMGWNGGGFLTDPSTRVKIDRKTKDSTQNLRSGMDFFGKSRLAN